MNTRAVDRREFWSLAEMIIDSHLTEALVRAGTRCACVRSVQLIHTGLAYHCAPDVKGKFKEFAGDVRDPNGV